MEPLSEEVIEWANLSEFERKQCAERPVAFVNFQNHVVITTEHMLVFEPEGIAMDDPSLRWMVIEEEIGISEDEDGIGCLDLDNGISFDALPLGFSHTDLVIAWDHNFVPHCILLSKQDYSYYYTVDIESTTASAELLRKCLSVESQPPILVKNPDGYALTVEPTSDFFNLAKQISDQHPNLLQTQLSTEELIKVEAIKAYFAAEIAAL